MHKFRNSNLCIKDSFIWVLYHSCKFLLFGECSVKYEDNINGDLPHSKFMFSVLMACNHVYSRQCLSLSVDEVLDRFLRRW